MTNLGAPAIRRVGGKPTSRPGGHGLMRSAAGPGAGAGHDAGQGAAPGILLVEDDFLVASEMEAGLLDAGLNVVGVAATAADAVRLTLAERPALAIMDIRLAGVRDGIDAALEIFRTTGVRCIFATAHNDPRTRARAEPAAPLGWIAKPYSVEALIVLTRRALAALKS
jgi:DNA-binding NarL/FixJ family response regulator